MVPLQLERFLLRLSVIFISLTCTCGYRNVVYLHGVLANGHEGDDFNGILQKRHPGTNVTALHIYEDLWSLLEPISDQARSLTTRVQEIMDRSPDGIHLVCYSQGAFVCRAMLQAMEHHTIHNFISLSGPLAGQYGVTSVLERFFVPLSARSVAYLLFYSSIGQHLSIANYWNDPFHQDILLDPKYDVYLAQLNNKLDGHHNSSYPVNFPQVENAVLVGGPDDGVITPWQSSHFGFYNESLDVMPMEYHTWFKENSFGLRTLSDEGRLHACTVAGIEHHHWYRDQGVLDQCLIQWLD